MSITSDDRKAYLSDKTTNLELRQHDTQKVVGYIRKANGIVDGWIYIKDSSTGEPHKELDKPTEAEIQESFRNLLETLILKEREVRPTERQIPSSMII